MPDSTPPRPWWETPTGVRVPGVTADEMRAVDRVAVDDVGLQLLQMMENAGRGLATVVRSRQPERVVVVAGNGGNGGGGLACARHLANRGVEVSVARSCEVHCW
jgi:NAD(P)H-hydrate epimerase